jgi:hypothetical protein
MGEGKLICSGSSVYLKNKFGVGYNLTSISKKEKNIKNFLLQYYYNYYFRLLN